MKTYVALYQYVGEAEPRIAGVYATREMAQQAAVHTAHKKQRYYHPTAKRDFDAYTLEYGIRGLSLDQVVDESVKMLNRGMR